MYCEHSSVSLLKATAQLALPALLPASLPVSVSTRDRGTNLRQGSGLPARWGTADASHDGRMSTESSVSHSGM